MAGGAGTHVQSSTVETVPPPPVLGAPVVVAERLRDPVVSHVLAPDAPRLGVVLVALDGSVTAEAALPHAIMIARAAGASIHLVRVVGDENPLALVPVLGGDASQPGLIEVYRDGDGAVARSATVYLEEVADRLRAGGLVVACSVRTGPPGPRIATTAAEFGAALLVLASEPHRGLARLAGSVADEVLRIAPCPVVYVRTGPPADDRNERIRNFAEEVARAGAVTSVRLGLREVLVERITGSVGRAHELLPSFRPRRPRKDDQARFQGVCDRLDQGQAMPPLELYKLGFDYYVLDGHHRVAAAQQLGIRELEAEVHEYLSPSDAEQQQVFLERRAFERDTGLMKVGASRIGTYPALAELLNDAPERANPVGRAVVADARERWQRWYFGFFQEMQKDIKRRGLRQAFPGERSADILARMARFRDTEARLGQEVSWETALDHFAVAYGRRGRVRSWSLRDFIPGVRAGR